jgi:enoyl-CoA hydratase
MRVERHGQVALLRLEAGKANAISAEFLDALEGLLAQLGDARAAVITGQGSAFCAGLDLPSLLGLDRDGMRRFIARFDAVMTAVARVPVPVVAAINGHAIAGGTVLALQCDLRLASDNPRSRLGLSETQLGIGLPAVVLESLRAQVPPQSLVPIALEGRLFSPAEALQLGLVHEVLPEADLLPRAMERGAALAALPPEGVRQVKAQLRRPALEAARIQAEAEREFWLDSWLAPEPQARLQAAVARLAKKA